MKTGIMFCTNKRVKTRIYIVMFCLFSLCATGCNKETKEAGKNFIVGGNSGSRLEGVLIKNEDGTYALDLGRDFTPIAEIHGDVFL